MKSLPEAARVQNRASRKSSRQFCPNCGNSGYVVVAIRKPERVRVVRTKGASSIVTTRPEYEEHGPCPFCEQGLAEEFDEQAPWGASGFWQGRELPELQSLNPNGNKLLPLEENRRRMRELAERMGAIATSFDPEQTREEVST